MSSPFKFLDAYGRQDRDQFFGRDTEIDQLYDLVHQNRLVLVYGESGTGKTSLIQCGLGNRFDVTDWKPLFIRRGNHLPTAFQHELERSLDEKLEKPFWEMEENPLPEMINELFEEYLRPIYLIFDQLEELFVLGDEAEMIQFAEAMADIYHAKLPCRMLFVMREEYLAHLYEFEKRIPNLFHRRLRVEAMSATKAAEVVSLSCERFNIHFSQPESDPQLVVDKVSAGRSGVSLPYLQVYLDRLYRDDYIRTYPGKAFPKFDAKEAYPELEFTTQEINEFGEIGSVLKAFLKEQETDIQRDAKQKFPQIIDRAVVKILNRFASLQGTKIPRKVEGLILPAIAEEEQSYILERLLNARILRENEGTYELTHDALAEEIDAKRSVDDEAIMRITDLVVNRQKESEKVEKVFLTAKELRRVEDVKELLEEEKKLGDTHWKFIEKSRSYVKRRRNIQAVLISGAMLILTLLLVVALIQRSRAFEAREKAETAIIKMKEAQAGQQKALAEAIEAKAEAELAKQQLQEALAKSYEAAIKIEEKNLKEAQKSLQSGRASNLPTRIISRRSKQVEYYENRKDSVEIELIDLKKEIDQLNPFSSKKKK